MRDDEGVVSDTSPLLNLALIDRLDLLDAQFDSITVPETVWSELTRGDAGVTALQDRRDAGLLETVVVERDDLFVEVGHTLDAGETAAITHAIRTDADLVLLDERDGRQVARRHDLEVTGVIGVLLRGAADGMVELRPTLDALREAGFWIADDLYDEVLETDFD